jgi:hypothetical protein
MSTLQVTNIQATGETASRAVSGVAAAWVNFNGTGTPSVRDSSNVASITDNAAGDFTVNFSNAFGAGDYSVGAYSVHGSGSGVHVITGDSTTGDPSASSIRVRSKNQAVTIFDPSTAGLNMMGDLA